MKKLMAVLLTACLTFQTCAGVVTPVSAADIEAPAATAEETPDAGAVSEEETPAAEAEEPLDETASPAAETTDSSADIVVADSSTTADAHGALEVKITSALTFQKQLTADVYVEGTDISRQETVSIDTSTADSSPSFSAYFGELPAGDYTVRVKASKFADFTQKVTVKDYFISEIQLSTAQTLSSETAVPGWLRIGDVNGDGIIRLNSDLSAGEDKTTKSDEYLILNAIRNNPDDTKADLNGDGSVDILDLHLMVRSRALTGNEASAVTTKAIPSEMETLNGTTIESGKLEDLLKTDETIVSLKPKEDAPISESNPVEFAFEIADTGDKMGGITIKAPIAASDGGNSTECNLEQGQISVDYKDTDGSEKTARFDIATGTLVSPAAPAAETSEPGVIAAAFSNLANLFTVVTQAASLDPGKSYVMVEPDGSLVVDFGGQIAVKRVTITITGTRKKEDKLVNIAKVEFVNDMEKRIAAPEMNTPTGLSATPDNEEFELTWTPQTNVTGYEVSVKGAVKKATTVQEQIIRVSTPPHRVSMINDYSLKNFTAYECKIRSVNGEWRSPWSNTISVTPSPKSIPDPVDNVTAVGNYRSIKVSWKDMKDSNRYMVEYKKRTESATQYRTVVNNFTYAANTGKQQATPENALEGTSYSITGLEDGTEYQVRVRGWNDLGWGNPSAAQTVSTISASLPELPDYYLWNTPQKSSDGKEVTGALTSHIQSTWRGSHGNTRMVESPLDTNASTANGVVDNDYASYWTKKDWDDGVSYIGLNHKGIDITFDSNFSTNYFTFAEADQNDLLHTVRVWYSSEAGGSWDSLREVYATLIQKTDKNNKVYYIVRLGSTINARRIHFCVGTGYASIDMKIGEVHFHKNDGLQDEIWNLYSDEEHTTLKSSVTKAQIDSIEAKLKVKDSTSGELHPLRDELALELATARKILEGRLEAPIPVDNTITASRDGHLGFGGLNPWQPLGKVGYAGETISIFVGHNSKHAGEQSDLQFVYTQQHAESDRLSGSRRLNVGENTFTIPATPNNNNSDVEQGGLLYIAYTGNNPNDQYAVRMEGGSPVPKLNLYRVEGSARTEAIRMYVTELESYVSQLTAKHNAHADKFTKISDTAYDEKNCILNATDIMLEDMMYSVPASQILNGLGTGTASEKATRLDTALKAMESAMTLFYQHKGLSDDPTPDSRGTNTLPSQHLNIRYMRMFSGAFMYASGNHIGIEYPETSMASSARTMNSFGWGIGHEIGHDINQGSYAIAEITNNYFAQLMTKTDQTSASVRWKDYANVYEKVTSGAVGRSPNVGTQLALYWQLHLAFDDQPDTTIFESREDIFNNLFFARVDTFSRNPSKAPLENVEPKLSLKGNADQNIMRLACAASGKNLLNFFERWGMEPNDTTVSYAKKFGDRYEKALYYVNDDARNYRREHPEANSSTATGADVVESAAASADGHLAKIVITPKSEYRDVILGYEIIRGMYTNGEKTEEVVGFTLADSGNSTTYVDTISTINNRVMYYKVKAVDKYLNYSSEKGAGSAKIQTDGVLNKSGWTVETTMTSADDTKLKLDSDDPDNGYGNGRNENQRTLHSIDRILDNGKVLEGDTDTTYNGTISGDTGKITVDMQKVQAVTALKYKGSDLENISIEVSEDGTKWRSVKTDCTECKGAPNRDYTVWFDPETASLKGKWIGTYDARYVRLTIKQTGSLSIDEIELCGPSGDNIEFLGESCIGILAEDFIYGTAEADKIPEGSLVVTGTYKGNSAYNVVMLYDADGNVVGANEAGTKVNAEQIVFSDNPENGVLGDTYDGRWVYYVRPENWNDATVKAISESGGIRAELLRVDDAKTLEGERIVSDTKPISFPENAEALPDIHLTGISVPGQHEQ